MITLEQALGQVQETESREDIRAVILTILAEKLPQIAEDVLRDTLSKIPPQIEAEVAKPVNEEKIVSKVIGKIKLPKDGTDGSPDTGEEIVSKVNGLPKKPPYQIDVSHIKGIQDFVSQPLARGGTAMIFEAPSGAVNGINVVYTLAFTPKSALFLFFVNGQLLKSGGEDYTLSGSTVTCNTAPPTGSILLAFYSKF